MHASAPRTPVSGPTFVRLLARLADTPTTPDGPAPAEQLGLWVDWTRAVALARALDATPVPGDAVAEGDDADACAQARAQLAAGIADDEAALATGEPGPVREHCLRQQRAIQAACGRLRGRLRDRLAAGTPELARLAEVDAVMEGVLSPREAALLATVPERLLARHARLREAAGEDADAVAARAWRERFRNDMRELLLAELDLRFQPIDGLLAALRTR